MVISENALDDKSFPSFAMLPNRRREDEHNTENGDDTEEEREVDEPKACFTAIGVRPQRLKQGIFEQHRKSLCS